MARPVSSRATANRTVVDRLYKPGAAKPVAFCPGWTGTKDYFADDTTGNQYTGPQNTAALNDAGFPVIGIDEGSLWGNSTYRTNMGTAKTAVQTALAASGKIGFFSISAGGSGALNYAINNPTLVFAMVLCLPSVNLQRMWDEDPTAVGMKASIGTAYGGRPSNGENPLNNAAALSGIPHRLYYSSNDPYINPTDVEAFAALSGGELVSQGAAGHTMASPYTPALMAAYLAAHIS